MAQWLKAIFLAEETNQFPEAISRHMTFSDPHPRGSAPSSDLHRNQMHMSCADMHGDKTLKHIKISKRKCIKSYSNVYNYHF